MSENETSNDKENQRKLLDSKGVFKIKFREIRNPFLGTLIVICEFVDKFNTLLSRGVSVCSFRDTFERKFGRNKAFERARDAIISEKNDGKIREDIPEILSKRSLVEVTEEKVANGYLDVLIPHIMRNEKVGPYKYRVNIRTFFPLSIAWNLGITYKSEYKPEKLELDEVRGFDIK